MQDHKELHLNNQELASPQGEPAPGEGAAQNGEGPGDAGVFSELLRVRSCTGMIKLRNEVILRRSAGAGFARSLLGGAEG